MTSMQWTAEESRYLKAIFSWQDRFDDEQDGGTRVRDATARACVGDFRVLMIGTKAVGKTALLTRFCQNTFQDVPDPRHERGGRRPIRINRLLYNMDVLEMPSQHLIGVDEGTANTATPAALMLDQALALTEAAIVVYDVCDPLSFQEARKLYNWLQARARPEALHGSATHSTELQKQNQQRRRRPQQPTSPAPVPLTDRPKSSRSFLPKRKSMRFRSSKKDRQQQQQQQKENAKPSSSPSPSSTAQAAVATTRPFALILVGNKSDADDGERRVAWIDGSKAAAQPFSSSVRDNNETTASADVPPVPPMATLHNILVRKQRSSKPGNEAEAATVMATPMPASSMGPTVAPAITHFMEASAKTGDNVDEIFVQIGREIVRQRSERKRQHDAKADAEAADPASTGESASAASSSTNRSLLRMKSHASAATARRSTPLGVLRVLGLSFGRRPVAADAPVVA